MITYKSFEVLEVLPNEPDGAVDRLSQGRIRLATETGISYFDESTAVPSTARTVTWTCKGYEQIQALKQFLDRRKGRVNPFWFPSWKRDLVLRDTVAATASSFKIERIGYSANIYPGSGSRRHAMFYAPSYGMELKTISSASDVPASGWELLGVSSQFVGQWASGSLVSFLRLVRLAGDFTTITYLSQDVAEAAIEFLEIPMEAPLS